MTKNITCSNSFSYNHQVLILVLTLILLILFFETTNIDLWVQKYLYNTNDSSWLVDRNNSVMKFLFYDGIKLLYFIIVISIIFLLSVFRRWRYLHGYHAGLVTMLLSMILIPLFVAWLKQITNIPCPNDLLLFNGTYPYVTLFSAYPVEFHQIDRVLCYPAGHASGGFALLSLYFVFKSNRIKIMALGLVLITGWAIGFYKMAIGDHFLSHTIISMIIAWVFTLTINQLVIKIPERKSNHECGR